MAILTWKKSENLKKLSVNGKFPHIKVRTLAFDKDGMLQDLADD